MERLDEAAFSAFYASHARPLWAYVYRVTGHAADADDIVQEAFLRVLRQGPDNDDREQWKRFLFRVASNLVVDRWRMRKREEEAPMDTFRLKPGATGVDPHTDLEGDSGHRLQPDDRDVVRTFAELTARERALLWLAYVEEESHEEIAEALGVGRRSIKVMLFRAKRRLRALLQAKGLART